MDAARQTDPLSVTYGWLVRTGKNSVTVTQHRPAPDAKLLGLLKRPQPAINAACQKMLRAGHLGDSVLKYNPTDPPIHNKFTLAWGGDGAPLTKGGKSLFTQGVWFIEDPTTTHLLRTGHIPFIIVVLVLGMGYSPTCELPPTTATRS